jgi:hypothetical protein
MALNWTKGLEAVSEGLIRQADIGGLMYKEAASTESARKAGQLQEQERLWDIGVQFAKQADSDYQTILEAVIEAEATAGDIGLDPESSIMKRFEQAQTRRNDSYANLGAISPGGGEGIQYPFAASIKRTLDVARISDVEDWRKTFAEGKTPKTVNTLLETILDTQNLTGNAEARRQLEEQFLSALQQPTKEEATAGARGGDIEGTGLISQAAQGTPSDQPGYEAGVGFGEWWKRGVEGKRLRREETRESGRRFISLFPNFAKGLGASIFEKSGVKEQASELNNVALQRALSQMSQQGQQYWEQYMQVAQREGRSNAISTLSEVYNALSEADRQIVLQLQSALGI